MNFTKIAGFDDQTPDNAFGAECSGLPFTILQPVQSLPVTSTSSLSRDSFHTWNTTLLSSRWTVQEKVLEQPQLKEPENQVIF